MPYTRIAARLILIVVAIAAATATGQTGTNLRGSELRATAVNIEKTNKRPVAQLEASIKEYERLVEGSPDDAVIMNNLGAMYFLAGRYYESQSIIRKALRRSPRSVPIRINLAIALNRTHNSALAIDTLESVLAEAPDQSRAREILCELYAKEDRIVDSMECFDVLFKSGEMAALGAANYATLLIDAGSTDRALEVLRWADSEFAENAGVKNSLGVALYKKKKFKAAETHLQRAVAMEPASAQLRFNLAMAQMAGNNRGAVFEQYKFLKTASPELARRLYQLLFRDKIVRVKPE